ncbi:hypothetical protein J2Y45_000773 [Dyadobacter sp. BE34]|uniref:Peptidase S74 domain-containing protein n=1 Tax=Dyadobacter fermentans TaxID=94254 RepID=A0ABU1QQS0_9BACT|nr:MULTISPECIES: tail fiber domain-containing protein [Dyadobacter]MDR6803503.1 hypothetical protein [Dyadobacter fermentans]MDR7041244.1 hypothetical protein [Dyadobacter sp. BE242]MDR7195647.1 hypothetical protein [Dyadobacter sp. BE34]MDR7213808.1 hypothetical protein [Dyadobacter sp. BE31]MDR7261054.1 hypothetical protein [Dyadobacter sp. BE32]
MRNLLFKFSLPGLMYLISCTMVFAQLGVGTNLPQARLHVYNGTFLSQTPKLDPQTSPFYDMVNFDDDSVHHAFKWMPEKSALRAVGSSIYSNTLDPTKVGKFTVTSGFDTFATGLGASARGLRASATALATFASGQTTVASYDLSFAQGYFTNANGLHCVTIGTNLSNNYTTGAFVMGHSSFSFQNTNDHQFRMSFEGGYRFYSSNLLISGVMLPAGANAWSMISDVAKKEKFIAVDGRKFLQKIEAMPLPSWNYKGQDPKPFRHYGPMAQDFFRAFGSDACGAIGTDTTINQADLDGVTLIAIQTLARETEELQKVNDDLEKELAALRRRIASGPGPRHPPKNILMANRRR